MTADTPDILSLSTKEFDALCRKAVRSREPVPSMEYTTLMDGKGNLYQRYADGRVEYVLTTKCPHNEV